MVSLALASQDVVVAFLSLHFAHTFAHSEHAAFSAIQFTVAVTGEGRAALGTQRGCLCCAGSQDLAGGGLGDDAGEGLGSWGLSRRVPEGGAPRLERRLSCVPYAMGLGRVALGGRGQRGESRLGSHEASLAFILRA